MSEKRRRIKGTNMFKRYLMKGFISGEENRDIINKAE
jgi:hypothetical protein